MTTPDGKKISFASSFGFAMQGIAFSAAGRNFRVQLAFGALALGLGAAFSIGGAVAGRPELCLTCGEWLAVVICIGMVLGGECLNTGLEEVVDLVSPGWNEHAKHAKDCAAGAVYLFSAASLVVGIAVFLPRLLLLLS